MQHDTETAAAPILPEADWPLRALSSIHGISRVLRRLHHALEPQERQALAEAMECLSDEMLEKGGCA